MIAGNWKRLSPQRQSRLDLAVELYRNRQARVEHPEGSFDSKGRWYPSETEKCDCCDSIRQPSRSYPLSLNKHCRSVAHIAKLASVDPQWLRKALRPERQRQPVKKQIRYKAVGVDEKGQFRSCFDGSEWAIGKTRVEKARREHNGGFYCYRSIEAASQPSLPTDIEIGPGAILEVEVWGVCIPYFGGKEAWTYCKPLRQVACFWR